MAYQMIRTFRVRLNVAEAKDPEVLSPSDSADVLRAIDRNLDEDQEHVTVLALDGSNKTVGYKVIASGQMDSSHVDLRLLFRAVLALGGSGFVLAHNHPTGNQAPSDADRQITKRIKDAAAILGLRYLDHVIQGEAGQYFSFLEHG